MTAFSPSRRHLLAAAVFSASALLLPAAVLAQPDLSQPLGPTIADTGSAFYRFECFSLRSADGLRGYRITLGIPRRAAPPAGYPAIFLLDGNAALAALDERQLQALDAGHPPVLVALGYDTPLRFDVQARAFDYTPPIPPGQADEEAARARRGGGADTFLDLIAQEIMPRVRRIVALDDGKLALWGHSYGGLFVLHALFTRPAMFSAYIAASPSLWWQRGVILEEEKCFAGAAGVRLWVMAGEAERRERPAVSREEASESGQRPALTAMRAAMPPQALPEMIQRLQASAGVEAFLRMFPGMAHGPMLPASLEPALRIAAGLPPWPMP